MGTASNDNPPSRAAQEKNLLARYTDAIKHRQEELQTTMQELTAMLENLSKGNPIRLEYLIDAGRRHEYAARGLMTTLRAQLTHAEGRGGRR